VAIIPSILYKDSKEEAEAEKKKVDKEKEKVEEDLEEEEGEGQPDEEEVEEVNLEEEEELQEAINLSNKMAFDAFLGLCFSFAIGSGGIEIK
jgi:hypothetical protein